MFFSWTKIFFVLSPYQCHPVLIKESSEVWVPLPTEGELFPELALSSAISHTYGVCSFYLRTIYRAPVMCQLWWKTKLLPCGPQVFTLELTLSAPGGASRPGLVGLLGFVTASSSPAGKVPTRQWHCHHLPCPFELPGLECWLKCTVLRSL